MLLEIRLFFAAVFNVDFCWYTLVVRLLRQLFGIRIFTVDDVTDVIKTDWQAVSGFRIEMFVDHPGLADFDYTTRDYVASSTDGRSLTRILHHLGSSRLLLQLGID